MQTSRGRTILAVAGTVLLVALVVAGCGRRSEPLGSGTAVAPGVAARLPSPASTETPLISSEPAASPYPVSPAPDLPATTAPSVPADAPNSTPDLTSIQDLLTQIDNDLKADASAGTSEGNPQ